MRLADTGTRATSDYPVVFDGVTFAVDRFAAGHPVILKGSPTWASKGDWTYSLGEVAMPAGSRPPNVVILLDWSGLPAFLTMPTGVSGDLCFKSISRA